MFSNNTFQHTMDENPWLTNPDMEIDSGAGKVKPAHSSSSKSSKKGKGRVEKKRHRKEKNNIAFKKSSKPRKIRDKIGRA